MIWVSGWTNFAGFGNPAQPLPLSAFSKGFGPRNLQDCCCAIQAARSNIRFPPIIAVNTFRVNVRFGEAAIVGWTAQMVKVFGCRQAYENRPSTNPRACGSGLWGFRFLPERDEGGVGAAMAPTGTRRVRLCSRRSLDWELAACEVQVFCHGVGEGRADGGRRNKGRCGAR